jgi:hypothetical protein
VAETKSLYPQYIDQAAHLFSASLKKSTAQPTTLQRATNGMTPLNDAPLAVNRVLQSGTGCPLDDATRTFMEPRFGYDFSDVRVHADAGAAESARAINALAYTLGHDIVFGTGKYAPGTAEGRKLLAHELTHVVQQSTIDARASESQPTTVARSQYKLEAEVRNNAENTAATGAVSANPVDTGILLMRQPANPEDEDLRELATMPGLALKRWRQLRPLEQSVLVTYMAMLYDVTFARSFQEEALRRPKPELYTRITNDPDATPEYLTARGYKLRRSSVNVQYWVHPSGKEEWVISRSTESQQQAPAPEHPPVTKARSDTENVAKVRHKIKTLTEQKEYFTKRAKQLGSHVSELDYHRISEPFWDAFQRWEHDLDKLSDDINDLRNAMLPETEEDSLQLNLQIQTQLERWEGLDHWRKYDFPDLVRGLPERTGESY